ncbi:hypothetical protein OG897_13465 [Streptomyces sp. NBC_00237]|uniref:hypothetical protein n=1 Tax=Streptomyces sp. NBC_00237 TaxID=2975687 RepID=UPI0022578B3D|nr:hypothetical protein [Streptomyces sp. NBC_00237]MCX5202452.1 hypothetical protein [Streptomyces sp. NBC_00237]
MSALSAADRAAHESASYVRSPREVLARIPAGHPRGSWPAEEVASRLGGTVVQDLDTDDFLVIAEAVGVAR